MVQHSLLLVDSDAQQVRVIEVSLRKAGYTVQTARDIADALTKLDAMKPDLIVSDTVLPDGSGFEFCRNIKRDAQLSSIPFIFLTNDNSVDSKIRGLELGAEDYLIRPVYTRELAARIQVILEKRTRAAIEQSASQRRFFGELRNMSVVDLLQAMEMGRKSGALRIDSEGQRGSIWFRDGQIIDANAEALQGNDAVYRMLTWDEGTFEADFRPPRRPMAMNTSTQELLMEGLRRTDEWAGIAVQLPSLDTVFAVDYEELSEHLGELEDDVTGLVRLFDGSRTAREVIATSGLADLDALEAVSTLYFEGIIAVADDIVIPEKAPVPDYKTSLPPAAAPTIADALLESVSDSLVPLPTAPETPALDAATEEVDVSPPPPPPEAFTDGETTDLADLLTSATDQVTSNPAPLQEESPAMPAADAAVRAEPASLESAFGQNEEEVFPSYDGEQETVADVDEENAFFGLDSDLGMESLDGDASYDFGDDDDDEAQGSSPIRLAVGLGVLILVLGVGFLVLQDKVEPLKTPPKSLNTKWVQNQAKTKQPVGSVPAIDAGWQIPTQPDGGVVAEPILEAPAEKTQTEEATPEKKVQRTEKPVAAKQPNSTKAAAPKTVKKKEPKPPIEVPKVSEKSAQDARALTASAIKLYKQEKYPASVKAFEKALALSPGSKAALVGYTKALLEVGRTRDALEAGQKAARIDRTNPEVHLLLGNARQDLGMDEKSIESYEQYLKLAPNGRYAGELRQIIKGMKDGAN